IIANPSSLDPQVGPAGSDVQTLYPLFDTLIDFDPATLEPKPGLAESWEFRDLETLALTLRPGIEFHDGTPMDAEAVKESIELFIEAGAHDDLVTVDSVEAESDLEVVLHLNQPDSTLVLALADRA